MGARLDDRAGERTDMTTSTNVLVHHRPRSHHAVVTAWWRRSTVTRWLRIGWLAIGCSAIAGSAVGCSAWVPLQLDGVVSKMWHEEATYSPQTERRTPERWNVLVLTARGAIRLDVTPTTFAVLREGDAVRLFGASKPNGRARFDTLRRAAELGLELPPGSRT